MISGETTSENSNAEAAQADAGPTHRTANDERRDVYGDVTDHGPVRTSAPRGTISGRPASRSSPSGPAPTAGWPAAQGDRREVTDAVRSVAREGRHPAAEAFAEGSSGGETLRRRDAERRRVVHDAVVSNAVCGWAHLETFTRSRLRHTVALTGSVVEALRGAGVGSELPEYAAEAASRGDRHAADEVILSRELVA
ncbi:hypothetical protein BRD03_13175 [Halobacteriales archaeon QS_9_68_17]|nr:MAG: hypothetical protein BRD03_13175 [Halobacteriales archaeon QS_9_68_17]